MIDAPEDVGGYVEYTATELEMRNKLDSDGDGIPDYWETQYGLNKDYAADGNLKTVDENGEYTNLEMYLNSLVQDIMDKCREGGTVVE